MNVIDGSPYTEQGDIRRKAAHGRTAASRHAESLAALHADNPEIALSLIEIALAAGAVDPLYRCHHASCLKILGRFRQAEKLYWEILREHPETVEATQGLRALYHAVGKCGAMPGPARRGPSPRHAAARHWHRAAAHQRRN
jgi:hypothetical protein